MGSFDGAESSKLPHILGEKYGKHRIGLYRDYGLACFNTSMDLKQTELEKIL